MVLASGGAMRERQALLAFSAIALGAAAFVQLRSSAAERAPRCAASHTAGDSAHRAAASLHRVATSWTTAMARVATPDLLARGSAAALPAVPGVDGAAPANAPRHWRGRSLFAPCCERDGRGLQARARTDHDHRRSA